jgi:hypothetical protein
MKINSENSFYARSIVKGEFYSDDYDDDDEENWKLLKPRAPSSSDYSNIREHCSRSSETIFKVTNLQNPFDNDEHDEESLARDTEFVVSAINESHESLRKLVSK